MKKADLEYLCRVIGNLAGIPIRIYKNKKQSYFYSVTDFPKDPITPYVDKIFTIEDHIGYFITPFFNYYGVVRSRDTVVVIGPSRQTRMSERDIRELAFACEVDRSRIEDFIKAMRGLIEMPLGSILQILCTMNYVMNEEKITLNSANIYDFDNVKDAFTEAEIEEYRLNEENKTHEAHNLITNEQILMKMISDGEVIALREWLPHAPSIHTSPASDSIREIKNAFVVTAALTSRAAIEGGLDTRISISLSDDYVRKCEVLSRPDQIGKLRYTMILDFANRVEALRSDGVSSGLIIKIRNYIHSNLSKPISVNTLAESIFISRTHLAARFKAETGFTLSEFIMKEKITVAKRMLRESGKSLTLISEYLGFSSQSHFTKSFKKLTGVTPHKYREMQK